MFYKTTTNNLLTYSNKRYQERDDRLQVLITATIIKQMNYMALVV
jgi:hypothetical protein